MSVGILGAVAAPVVLTAGLALWYYGHTAHATRVGQTSGSDAVKKILSDYLEELRLHINDFTERDVSAACACVANMRYSVDKHDDYIASRRDVDVHLHFQQIMRILKNRYDNLTRPACRKAIDAIAQSRDVMVNATVVELEAEARKITEVARGLEDEAAKKVCLIYADELSRISAEKVLEEQVQHALDEGNPENFARERSFINTEDSRPGQPSVSKKISMISKLWVAEAKCRVEIGRAALRAAEKKTFPEYKEELARQNNPTLLAQLRDRFSADPNALEIIKAYGEELRGIVFVSDASASDSSGKKVLSPVWTAQPLFIPTSPERADAIGQLIENNWKVICDTLKDNPSKLRVLLAKITGVLLNKAEALKSLDTLLRSAQATAATIKIRVVDAAIQENW